MTVRSGVLPQGQWSRPSPCPVSRTCVSPWLRPPMCYHGLRLVICHTEPHEQALSPTIPCPIPPTTSFYMASSFERPMLSQQRHAAFPSERDLRAERSQVSGGPQVQPPRPTKKPALWPVACGAILSGAADKTRDAPLLLRPCFPAPPLTPAHVSRRLCPPQPPPGLTRRPTRGNRSAGTRPGTGQLIVTG